MFPPSFPYQLHAVLSVSFFHPPALLSLSFKSRAVKFKYPPSGKLPCPILKFRFYTSVAMVMHCTQFCNWSANPCISSHQGCFYPWTNIFEKKDSTHHLTHTHRCPYYLRNPQVDGEGQNFLLRDTRTLFCWIFKFPY